MILTARALRLRSPPWTALQWGGATLMIAAPLVCYPSSKTLFLAFDLMFRPAQPEEFEPIK